MATGLGTFTFSRISGERQPHPDPVVNALGQLGWEDGEPMNAHDHAVEIVAIVRRAIESEACND